MNQKCIKDSNAGIEERPKSQDLDSSVKSLGSWSISAINNIDNKTQKVCRNLAPFFTDKRKQDQILKKHITTIKKVLN